MTCFQTEDCAEMKRRAFAIRRAMHQQQIA